MKPTSRPIIPWRDREAHQEYASPSTHTDARFWENYLVRYLLPTVVGAALVWILLWQIPNAYDLPTILKKSHPIDSTFLILIGFAGFVYCYVSSSLVLVMHYGRWIGRSSKAKTRQPSDTKRSSWQALDVRALRNALLVAVVGGILFFASIKIIVSTQLSPFVQERDLPLFLFALYAIAWQWIVAIRACSLQTEMHTFYKSLAGARLRPSDAGYVESYKHLREHGNAFFIVFAEVLFFFYLCFAIKLMFPYPGHIAPNWQIPIGAVFVLAWIFPGVLAWYLGTELELGLVATESRRDTEHAA